MLEITRLPVFISIFLIPSFVFCSVLKIFCIYSQLVVAPLFSAQISDLQIKCEDKSRYLQKILENELSPLIEEMSELQTAKVLSGNFDLKIARQDYFISKQEEVRIYFHLHKGVVV